MEIIIKNQEYINDFIRTTNTSILKEKEFNNNNIVILGNFDGVHLGHLEIINSAIKKARDNNYNVLLYTFREYPKKSDNLITTLNEKLYILSNLDLDYVYLEEFNDVCNLSPKEFIEKILINKLNAIEIYCGFNYTFGKEKKGDVSYLIENINKNIKINVINPVVYDVKRNLHKIINIEDLKSNIDDCCWLISSTFIKTLIENGDMVFVNKLLGHEYIVQGKVIHGKKIARSLGFPTANIKNVNKKYPIYGPYGVKVTIEGIDKEYIGMMNIGKNPTFEGEGINIETNIFNFNQDIYDKIITIKVLENLRLEKKMNSMENLKKQISLDKEKWRKIANEKYRIKC